LRYDDRLMHAYKPFGAITLVTYTHEKGPMLLLH